MRNPINYYQYQNSNQSNSSLIIIDIDDRKILRFQHSKKNKVDHPNFMVNILFAESHFAEMQILEIRRTTFRQPRSSIPTSDSRRKRYRSIEIPPHSCRLPQISRRNRPESNRILTQFSHRKCHRTGNVDFPSVSVKRNSIGTRPNPAGNHRKR